MTFIKSTILCDILNSEVINMFIGNINLKDIQKSFQMTDLTFLNQQGPSESHLHHPFELEKELDEAILRGDLDAIQAIGQAFNAYPKPVLCQDNPIRSRKNHMICTCTLITRLIMKAGVKEEFAYYLSDLYINKIETIKTIESLNYLNAIMIIDFVSQIQYGVKTGLSKHKKVKEALDFIHQNLASQLSLTLVADVVGLNKSYLSRLFKSHLTLSFTDYIQEVRIQQAQQLLVLTDDSISSIAYSVGFTSQSHFTKVFKKQKQTTPNNFRATHQNALKK